MPLNIPDIVYTLVTSLYTILDTSAASSRGVSALNMNSGSRTSLIYRTWQMECLLIISMAVS